ncbi:MAG TPA: SNF2-related protein [Hanamia sp.]|nr:SNF2-related protein [Hanamia sp.]
MILRDYQTSIAVSAAVLLKEHKIAYLSMEVRTGKTITALHSAQLFGAKKVIFLTKKKAIASIKKDYLDFKPSFSIVVTNYEQLQNFQEENFDLIICDEAHCLGQYPIAAERTKLLKNIAQGLPIIFLSGTPTPESFSQIFHQLHISSFSPFANHKNFYAWANAGYVHKKIKYVFNRQLNDYSQANAEKINEKIKHLFLSYTQKEAGFVQAVKEQVLKVEMKSTTYALAEKIKKHRVHIGKDGQEIVADTEVKLMQKLHQIYSGTVLTESCTAIIFDTYKADFIKTYFKGKKIAIFYKFKAEFTALLKTFGDQITLSPEEFNESKDKIFVSQVQSGKEGINLSTAYALVMYNIDFSAVAYQQAKARMQAKDKKEECLLYWIFSERGIEEKIYERVLDKKDFTLSWFRKTYKINKSKQLV